MGQRTNVAALREAARIEAARLIRRVAAPREFDETIQVCIQRAAHKLGWSYSRAEDIWRHEARRIESFEMDILRKLARVPRRNPQINSENAEFARRLTPHKPR